MLINSIKEEIFKSISYLELDEEEKKIADIYIKDLINSYAGIINSFESVLKDKESIDKFSKEIIRILELEEK